MVQFIITKSTLINIMKDKVTVMEFAVCSNFCLVENPVVVGQPKVTLMFKGTGLAPKLEL